MKIRKIAQTPGVVATVVDNLESESAVDALSAKQGKELKNLIENIGPVSQGALENFPIGTTVQYDGDTVPEGWEEVIVPEYIEKKVVSEKINTAGWYRVAKWNGQYGVGLIANVSTNYNKNNNMSTSLLINSTDKTAKVNIMNTQINSANIISKVRITLEGNTQYLEIYYNVSTENGVHVEILEQYHNSQLEMLDFEAPTDTATVLDELLITQDELNVSSLLKNGWIKHNGCQIFKQNDTVYVAICVKEGTERDILTLPEGYRPKELMYFPLVVDGSPATASYCSVSTSGALQGSNSTPNKLLFINFSYKV